MNQMIRSIFCLLALAIASARADQLKYAIAADFFDARPGNAQLGPCHGGTVIDKAGNIYVTTDTPRGIVVFSPEGHFLRAFGPTRIHGLELRNEDGVEYIYGARPSDHQVIKLKLDGAIVWTIEYPKESSIFKSADNFKPCAVTVGPDGSIYIADGYGSNYILKYDKDRKFIKAFGGQGKEEGKFNTCHGIALDTRGKEPLLFVCNRNNDRVEYWDLDGHFIKVIQAGLRQPAAVNIRGKYAVLPELQGRVTVLDQDGNIVAQVGDNPNKGQRGNYNLPPDQWTVGICNSPHGAAIDKYDNLIVTEWSAFGRVEKFDLQKAIQ